MSLIGDLFESRTSLANPDRWFLRWLRGDETESGVEVTHETALSSTAIFAGVRLLSEALGTVPFNVYRLGESARTREVDREHPVHRVLHDEFNPELTAAEGRSILLANAIFTGNGYAEIQRDGAGRVRALWPLWPHRVKPTRTPSGALVYVVRPPDAPNVVLDSDDVFHIRGFALGGLVGLDTVATMRESIGLTLAAEKFGSTFFGRGASPTGVLKHPATLSPTALETLRQSWRGGLSDAHRIRILEEGMSFEALSVPPEAAQFLETRRFQILEVARLLNMPPHLLRDLERATFSNIEAQGIEFVRYTLRPWAVLIEQRANRMLPESDRRTHYTKHVLEGLLRGDMKTRFESYAIGRNWGWLSANDVLELEDRNPIPDGDMYLVPSNMMPAELVGAMAANPEPEPEPEPPEPAEDDEDDDELDESMRLALAAVERHERWPGEVRDRRNAAARVAVRDGMRGLMQRVAAELVGREIKSIRDFLASGVPGVQAFQAYADRAYSQWPATVRAAFLDTLQRFAELILEAVAFELGGVEDIETVRAGLTEYVGDFADSIGVRWAMRSRRELQGVAADGPEAELEERILAVVEKWEGRRADRVADEEAVKGDGAFTRFVYTAAGVLFMRWLANGDACPLCKKADGRTTSTSTPFFDAGDTIDPDDDETNPMPVAQRVGHPPLHGGCRCSIVAAS